MKRYIAIVLALTTVAHADKKAKADELFKRAKKLMADKQYAEACPKFEESFKLDPALGAEVNLARCFEEWGKLGRAYRTYQDAEQQAKAANDPRAAKIHDRAAALEPDVPRLVIHIPEGADAKGLALTIDGVVVPRGELANPQLVDPGPKQIEYMVAGKKKTKLIPVERGGTSEITLDLPVAEAPPVAVEKPKPAGDDDDSSSNKHVAVVATDNPGHGQRIGGIVVGAVGIVGLGVGGYLALHARSKYNDAIGADCMGSKSSCDPAGLTATKDARSDANLASIVVGVGVAAVAGGVLLYVLSPHASTSEHALYIAPTGTGIAFGGRY